MEEQFYDDDDRLIQLSNPNWWLILQDNRHTVQQNNAVLQ